MNTPALTIVHTFAEKKLLILEPCDEATYSRGIMEYKLHFVVNELFCHGVLWLSVVKNLLAWLRASARQVGQDRLLLNRYLSILNALLQNMSENVNSSQSVAFFIVQFPD